MCRAKFHFIVNCSSLTCRQLLGLNSHGQEERDKQINVQST